MKKRLIALFLVLVLAVTCFPVSAFAAGSEGDDIALTGSDLSIDDIADTGASFYVVPEFAPDKAVVVGTGASSQLMALDRNYTRSFTVHSSGDDYYYFEDTVYHKVVEVAGGVAGKRARLQLANYDGSDKQLWQMIKGEKGFAIRSKLNTDFAWNSAGNRTTQGNAIQLWKSGATVHEFCFITDTPALFKTTDAANNYFICPQTITESSVKIGSNGKTQLWTIQPNKSNSFIVRVYKGYYYFEDYKSGNVLQIANGKAQNNSPLNLGEFDGSDKQLWVVNAEDKGFYQICSALDPRYALDNRGNKMDNGNEINVYSANHGQSQKYKFTLNAGISDEADDLERYGFGEEYSIVPCCAGGARIDMSTASDRSIQLYKTTLGTNQLWTFGKVGDYYYIKSKYDGKVVEVPGGNAVSGLVLSCADYNGSDKQLWALEDMNDGTFSLHSKLNKDLVWDVENNTSADFSKILLYPQHRYSNQRFRFVHISTVEPISEWGSKIHDCEGTNRDVWDGSYTYDWYYDHQNDNDFYINSASDLAGLASLVQNGNGFGYKTVHLMCDINLAEINWTPIGFNDHWFYGSFNGHDHSVIGLRRDDKTNNNGLFGQFYGGALCNLAVKGTIYGDYNTGGVVGNLERGCLYNIYSEVTIRNAADDFAGGIVGKCGYAGYIEHCTQNAKVNSNDQDNHRGGIVGYTDGNLRYCVNNARVYCNWNCVGGIAGTLSGGKIEHCANHGTIGGGEYAERIGGIVGETKDRGLTFGCYNDGTVYSDDDDYVGGIVGRCDGWFVSYSINIGRVYGDDQVGGISGWGRAVNCFNAGIVTGDTEAGAISGADHCNGCYALAWSAAYISGDHGEENSGFASAEDILSGKICRKLNNDGNTLWNQDGYYGSLKSIFSQNIGSDPYPTFGASEVTANSGKYVNSEYRVSVDYKHDYGTVTGAGDYTFGKVTLKATPAAGCVFEGFELKSCKVGKMTGWDGKEHDGVEEVVTTHKDEKITLTDNINQSYTVKANFDVFDEVPEDMRVTVKVEVECTDDAEGWNSSTIPIELVDTAGTQHSWEVSRYDLDAVGEKQSHTFYIGAANPVAVYATPDFGGGLTFRSYGLKARMWINGSGTAMESSEVIIRSWPFISSKWGSDYMSIGFGNYGNSTVANFEKIDPSTKQPVGLKSFTRCKDAWEYAKKDKNYTIRLESAWLLDGVLELTSGQSIKLDFNGYPIIRSMKKTVDDGELIKVGGGSVLTIVDSAPSRASSGNFTGGSIQGGRSDDTAGLIECNGTLNMTGGTLYNGGTTDKGGAIKLNDSGIANLTNVLISNCWSNKAVFYQNEGGAIYMRGKAKATLKNCTIRQCKALDYGGGIYLEDDDNKLTCENVNIISCTALENQGGGVYQDLGETKWVGGLIKNCRADEDDGGGFYQAEGNAYFENVSFSKNYSEDNGGGFYSYNDDKTWFVGCTFSGNDADDDGGAIYINDNYLYLQNCEITKNNADGDGGAIYIESSGSVDVAGKVIIKNNTGDGSMDNLVMEKGAFIYNHGLEPGSDIHLRSESSGNVTLASNTMSEYQMKQYFHADYGHFELTDIRKVNTELRSSVFSEGYAVIIISLVPVIIAAAVGIYIYKKKNSQIGKGEQ